MTTLVVLPSYNERENIVDLIEALLRLAKIHVCVVDDSSPDGTSDVVAAAIAKSPGWRHRVDLITRSVKDGRGGAVRDGFIWGLASGHRFSNLVEMDCDFSHRPDAIPEGIDLLEAGSEVVLGVRYPEGEIIDWPLPRRVFSRVANLMARILIDRSITDYTNGFRFYSARAARTLTTSPQRHTGYIYLSESLSLLLRSGYQISTFPIVFKNRNRGESSTTLSEILSSLRGVLAIGWRHRFSKR